MSLRNSLISLCAAAALLVFASPAMATDYCVGPVPGCSGVSYTFADGVSFASALTASNGNATNDRIFLAPGTYFLDPAIDFLVSGSQTLQIIGSGSASTIFTCTPAAVSPCFKLSASSSASSLSGVTAEPWGTNSSTYGIWLSKASGHDLAVVDPGGMGGFRGIRLDSASVDGCSISLASTSSIGLFSNNEDMTARNCTVTGGPTSYGVRASGVGTTATIDHSVFRDVETGTELDTGTMNISDSLIDLGSRTAATGMYAYYSGSTTGATILNADRVTVVGTAAVANGAYLGAVGTGQEYHATITDSVIYNPTSGSKSITTVRTLPTGASTVDVVRSAYNTATVSNLGTNPIAPANTSVIDLATTSPGFADFAARDYRPAAGSPLIDAGSDGSALTAGATDVSGAPRLVDGNGDGLANVDLGAYEYQLPPVVPPDLTAVAKITHKPKKSFKVGRKGGFGKANKGAASFSVKFTNSAKAKFRLKSIRRHKKLKSVKGSQTLRVSDGTIKLGFRGKWNKKKLKAGKYRVYLTPFNSAGAAGKTVTVDIKLK